MTEAKSFRAVLLLALGVACSPSTSHAPSGEEKGGQELSAAAPPVWGERQMLSANDVAFGDQFGISISISGDTVLVGAPGANDVGNNSGAAYVYVENGTSWDLQQRLLADDTTSGASFGTSVALSGDTAVIGAQADDDLGSESGSAYVFVRSGTTWIQQQKLTASDGSEGVYFGSAVSVSGDTALVSAVKADIARGAVYPFTRSGTSWTEQPKILAGDRAVGDNFGASLSMTSDTAIIGAVYGSMTGAAYVFVGGGATWSEQQKLTPSDGDSDDRFGISVAVSGDTVVVGTEADAAYVFDRSMSTWTERPKLVSNDAGAGDRFGASVALAGDTALLGAYLQGTNPTQTGAAFVFNRSGSAWSQAQRFAATGLTDYDYFGTAVALSGDVAIIGAPAANGFSGQTGAAFVFHFGEPLGNACALATECATGKCADGRCCNDLCDGACDACSVAAGASENGTCIALPAGATGSPPCPAPSACTGTSGSCSSCLNDTHCASDQYCGPDDACHARKAQGSACDLGAGMDCRLAQCRACGMGLTCTDGYCCDAACGGTCEACSRALTGAANGTCSPIPSTEDPENECAIDSLYPTSCQQDGTCDGARACRRYATRTTACGATTCDAGTVTGQLCNGAGQCRADAADCAPYQCDGDACSTRCADDVECASDAYCNDGNCEPKLPPGRACARAGECESAVCTDGVCCEERCSGQCEACNEPGDEGTCLAVTGEPRGDRDPCRGDGACAGTCDGLDSVACTYPGAQRTCGSACDGDAETVNACDGEGGCAEGRPSSCGDYACAGGACRNECAADQDCASGRRCVDGDCVPGSETCSEDASELINANGDRIACTPYRCEGSRCLDSCSSVDECAVGHVCSAERVCVRRSGAPASDSDGGCGCRTARRGEGGLGLAAFAWLALAALRRRIKSERLAARRLSGRDRCSKAV